MATKINISGGKVNCVYDDRFRPLFEVLGKPVIERATEVEYDPDTRDWTATIIPTGEIIARGKNRNEVIEAEVKWLEENHVSHRND